MCKLLASLGLLITGVLLFPLIGHSYAPNVFSFQGRLTDAGGNPLNGTYTMQFAIYAVPSGGTPLWTETLNSITVSNGLFTVGLGATNFSIWTAVQTVPRYLGVKVGSDPEMTPRTELWAVPYAQRVASVDSAYGGTIVSGITVLGTIYAQGGLSAQGYVSVNGGVTAAGNVSAASNNSAAAVYGYANSPSVNGIALFGRAEGPTLNLGVYGYATDAASAPGANCSGVYGRAIQAGGGTIWAGLFDGWTTVNGNFYASAKFFRIDDPQMPAERTLVHACVESNEYKNVYDGTVLLNADGNATVMLPDWFEDLNGGFRYQLTAIGKPGPNLHIAQELSASQFRIAGGEAGMKVSWQVTGVRQDPYALAHPVQVIQEKPLAQRGRYLNPKEYGVGEELSVNDDVRKAADEHAEAMRVQRQSVTPERQQK